MNRIKILVLAAAAALPAASMLLASAGSTNLIANGHFTANVAGWDNFSGNPQAVNGAMRVNNGYTGTGNSYFSAWYCAPVTSGVEYLTEGDYFVPADAPQNSGADLGLHYYASTDCSGSNLGNGGGGQSSGRFEDQRGKWFTFSFESMAPATAKSVRIRATAFKEPQPYSSSIPQAHYVLFDNMYFGVAEKAIANPQPTQQPDPTPEPEDKPVAQPEPTEEPEAPQDITDDPAPDPTPHYPLDNPEPAAPEADDEPAADDAAEEPAEPLVAAGPDAGDSPGEDVQESPKGNNSVPTTGPLPPSAGDTEDESGLDTNLALMAASAVSLMAGLGMIVAVIARRRREQQ